MASTTKHIFGICLFVAATVSLVACAAGTGGTADDFGDDDDDVVDARRIDASQVIDAPQAIDARIIDAPQLIDAPIVPIDAMPGAVPTGGTCAVDTDCALSTDCCFFGDMTCTPGMVLPPPFNFCFPD